MKKGVVGGKKNPEPDQVKGLVAKSRCVFQTPARAPDDRELRINFHIEENDFRWCRDHLPEGFKMEAESKFSYGNQDLRA